MQSIATTAGLGIDERNRQIVAAEKPEENPGRDRLPFGFAVRAPRDQARRNRRSGFQRLLIESARRLSEFAKARRTHGTAMPGPRRLQPHPPTQGSQPAIDMGGRLGS